MGLLDDFLEPIKEMQDISLRFRKEVVSSVGQIADEVAQAKTEGKAIASDMGLGVKKDNNHDGPELDKQEPIQ